MEELVKKAELIQLLNIGMSQLRNYETAGMPIARRGGGKTPSLYKVSDVMDWIENKGNSNPTLAAAKLRKLEAEASLAELELQKERGMLIEIVEVTRIVEKEYATVRAKLLALPSKVSGIIYSLQTQREVTDILDEHIREILTELSADTQQPTKLINARTEDDEFN